MYGTPAAMQASSTLHSVRRWNGPAAWTSRSTSCEISHDYKRKLLLLATPRKCEQELHGMACYHLASQLFCT